METIRQQKISTLIMKEMSSIFQKEGLSMISGALISITDVSITPDLSIARIYVSIFGSVNKKEIIEILKTKQKEIRFLLGNVLRNQLRIVPHLEFYNDETLDKLDRINELLKQ